MTSFLGALFKSGASEVHDGAIKFIAGTFPDLTSAAQIEMYRSHVKELAQDVGKKKVELDAAEALVDEKEPETTQMKGAAKILRQQAVEAGLFDAEGNELRKPSGVAETGLVSDFNTAMERFLKLKGQLDSLTARRDKIKASYESAKAECDAAALHATQAEERLADMKQAQEDAERDAREAEQDARDAERKAGMVKSLDSLSVAESAMQANVQAAQKRAAAAQQVAESYGKATGGPAGGDALKAAMAQASGQPAGGDAKKKFAALDD